jgi:hypothetical protein
VAFDAISNGSIGEYLRLSRKIGSPLAEQARAHYVATVTGTHHIIATLVPPDARMLESARLAGATASTTASATTSPSTTYVLHRCCRYACGRQA